MNDFIDKLDNAKDKLTGEINEAAGKATGNEALELKGKLLKKKADFEKKMDINQKVNDVKDDILGKINDKMDENEKK